MSTSTESPEIVATGRRKTSVASIRLMPGIGKIEVNGKAFEDYFPTVSLQTLVLQPLQTAKGTTSFDVVASTRGGGIASQAAAIRLAVARALVENDLELRPALKQEGLLRRDPRERERKKSGQPGARKRFQFSKR